MKLLTKDILRKLPALYANEDKGLDALVVVKFFTPDANATWYITEFDGEDTMFGLCVIQEPELGYVSLKELQAVRGRFGLPVERDQWFTPITLREAMDKHR